MATHNSFIKNANHSQTPGKNEFINTPLLVSIRKVITLGGLTLASSSAIATETHINPNEIWLSTPGNRRVCAHDIDQDGDIDLFQIHTTLVTLVKNIGTPESPQFSSPTPFTNDTGTVNLNRLGISDCFSSPLSVDIDADGDLDLFSSNYTKSGGDKLEFSRNIGTNEHPVFVPENPQDLFGLPNNASNYMFKDLDNDGDLDFLNYFTPVVYENTGSAEHAVFVPGIDDPLPPFCNHIDFLVDLNNDGHLDILCRNYQLNSFEYIASDGATYLPKQSLFNSDNLSFFNNIHVIDIDHDGDNDILGSYDNQFIVFTNTSTSMQPEFDKGSIYLTVPHEYETDNQNLADLDGDGDLDAIGYKDHLLFSDTKTLLTYALNSGSNANPVYQLSTNSTELEQCYNSILAITELHSEDPAIKSDFSIKNLSLVDIDGDMDLDLFSNIKLIKENIPPEPNSFITVYCENTGSPSSPSFSEGVVNPFGLVYAEKMLFEDIDNDGDKDVITNQAFYDNIGNANDPAYLQNSNISLHTDSFLFNNTDDENLSTSIIESSNGLRLINNGLEPASQISATSFIDSLIIATKRNSQIQLQTCFLRHGHCGNIKVLVNTAQEISLDSGDFNEDGRNEIVLAMIDAESKINIHVYDDQLNLIGSATEGFADSISVSTGQLDADPADEFVVSFVQADGKVAAVSYNLDGSQVGKAITNPGNQPSVAVGNFNATGDAYVLTYLSPDNQIITAIYKGDGTLLSQSNGEKSSYLSVIATDILSNHPGDEFVTTIIQEDGKAGLLGFSSNNNLLGKVVGNVSQQPDVVSGHFPKAESIGLAASVIQSDQKPAIFFLDNVGQLLAKAVGGTTASIATVTLADPDFDGIDEGILVYIDQTGLPRWEVFNADGTKK